MRIFSVCHLSADERIVKQVREGSGGIIDTQDDVGGRPVLEKTERKPEVPPTGRAEWLAGME